jgi:nucleotide-binding universal stress UspA family protein
MFKNVLVGVDGLPGGRDAIALAHRLADPEGKLTLTHVRVGPEVEGVELAASEGLLERERAATKVDAELDLVSSTSPGHGLHQRAESRHADLLVLGTCSHGAFGRAMLGDDTSDALNGAPCAVAIASLGYAAHGSRIANIGVGYDGSPESRSAIAMAHVLAAPTGAEVHALEVVSIPTYAFGALVPPTIGESIELILQEAVERLKELPDVDGHVVYGRTGEELAAFSTDMDILIVGSRGYGPVRRLVLSSTSNYLERHARSSLLVLPRVSTADIAANGKVHTDTSAAVAV